MTDVDEPSYEAQYRRAAGQVIGQLRAEQGWSYREFAEHVGTSHTNLYAVERGEVTPGLDVLGRIARAVGLDLPGLLLLIVAEMSADERTRLLAATRHLSRQDLGFLGEFAEFLGERHDNG